MFAARIWLCFERLVAFLIIEAEVSAHGAFHISPIGCADKTGASCSTDNRSLHKSDGHYFLVLDCKKFVNLFYEFVVQFLQSLLGIFFVIFAYSVLY